jgi:small conductance mechanosensitive channel
MNEFFSNLDLNQYLPGAIAFATNILLAILILIVGYWIAGRVSKGIRRLGKNYERLDSTLFNFLGSVARYVILAFVFIAVLNRFGVETTSIIALLGAAGLAVGLALQGAMSNLAAGVMLMIFRPYKAGDFIDAAGKFGNVQEISLFTTILRTFDHQQIIIPNGQIWGAQIVNHSHHEIRGVEMTFGVSYDSDIDATRAVIEKVFAEHPLILNDPKADIAVSTLNDSSVDFITRPFVKGEHWFDVRYSVPEAVKKALDKAGIEIPFPHQKVILFKGD